MATAKILCIPDSHGKEKLLHKAVEYIYRINHLVVFGDLVDDPSGQISDWDILNNLYDWMRLIQGYAKKLIFLWGSHDLPYFDPDKFPALEEQPQHQIASELQKFYQEYQSRFRVAWEYENSLGQKWLFTHAGLTQSFVTKHQEVFAKYQADTLAETLNQIFASDDCAVLWEKDGPLWVKGDDVLADPVAGYNQIIGHTPVPNIKTVEKDGQTIIMVDTCSVNQQGQALGDGKIALFDGQIAKLAEGRK